MKRGIKLSFGLSATLVVVTSVTLILVVTDLSVFLAYPLAYLFSLGAMTVSLVLFMRKDLFPFFFRRLTVHGKMLLPPLGLLLFSITAAFSYISFDLSGNDLSDLLTVIFSSLSVVWFFVSFIVFSAPVMALIPGITASLKTGCKPRTVILSYLLITALLSGLTVMIRHLTSTETVSHVQALPFLALLQVMVCLRLSAGLREMIREQLSPAVPVNASAESGHGPVRGIGKTLLFRSHYLDIISGRPDYLVNHGDSEYAAVVIRAARQTYDPALIPALNIISGLAAVGEAMQKEASRLRDNIDSYYTDPVRNRDMLRVAGITEETARARGMLISKRIPRLQEVQKLLNDPLPEIKKAGLAAVCRFSLVQLREEVVQMLGRPETSREAYFLLAHFGPGVYEDIIGQVVRPQAGEKVNILGMRLLNRMTPDQSGRHFINLLFSAPAATRLEAARYLSGPGYRQSEISRHRLTEAVNDTVYCLARVTAFMKASDEAGSIELSRALRSEEMAYYELLFGLITLLAGAGCASLLRERHRMNCTAGALVSREIINSCLADPVRIPLNALLGNHTAAGKLAELAFSFPLKEVIPSGLSRSILSSDQNITGQWTKACALRWNNGRDMTLDREVVLSYLFSSSLLLQEESLRVTAAMDRSLFSEVESRLPSGLTAKAAEVLEGAMPPPSFLFEKTLFLSMCFSGVPAEKLIQLAGVMNYSESYEAGPAAGLLTWIVPSSSVKTGLYSLRISDITDFIFYYSEYTDIFVEYMEVHGNGIARK